VQKARIERVEHPWYDDEREDDDRRRRDWMSDGVIHQPGQGSPELDPKRFKWRVRPYGRKGLGEGVPYDEADITDKDPQRAKELEDLVA